MKKLLFLLSPIGLFAQVGINTVTPSASLDLISKGNTGATKALEVNNSSAIEMVTVLDNGNVGINTSIPQKKLHINANNDAVRIETLKQGVLPATGVITVLNYDSVISDVTHINFKSIFTTPSITPNTSSTFSDPSGIKSGTLIIESGNSCGRFLISSFFFTDVSMVHINSIGRNAIGVATRNDTANSSDWTLVFPNVTGCADGGGGNQFDFRISKTSVNTYVITNLGNIAKSYKMLVSR